MLRPVLAMCVLPLLVSFPYPAPLSQNRVHIGRDIVIAAEQPANRSVCILCSTRVEGPVHGSVAVFAGNIYVDSAVHGSVLDFGGRITLAPSASVGGGVLVFGGQLYQDPAAKIGGRRIVLSPIVFLPLLVLLGVLIAGSILLLRRLFPHGLGTYPPLPRF